MWLCLPSRFTLSIVVALATLIAGGAARAVSIFETSFVPRNPAVAEQFEARLAVGGAADEATAIYTEGTYSVFRDRIAVYACEAPFDAPEVYLHSLTVYEVEAGPYSVYFHTVACVSDGVIVTPVGEPTLLAIGTVTVGSRVQEFYHPDLNHYFMTADPLEARWLAENVDTLGWRPTGFSFRAFTVDSHPSEAMPVYRFYGSVSPGPNSHFYTLDYGEYAFLRELEAATPPELPRWNFEAIAFHAYPPIGGACFFDQIPVHRLYNNGAAQNDSNHRYTTDRDFALAFASLTGWTYEGVVMCARQ